MQRSTLTVQNSFKVSPFARYAKETLSVRYLRLSIRWGWEIFIFSYFRVNKDQIYRSLSAIKFPKDRMLEWLWTTYATTTTLPWQMGKLREQTADKGHPCLATPSLCMTRCMALIRLAGQSALLSDWATGGDQQRCRGKVRSCCIASEETNFLPLDYIPSVQAGFM